MTPQVMLGFQQSLCHGKAIDYKVSIEGYTIAVKRMVHFISKVDAFNMFTLEDRRALIGNNCHLAINIKSARFLSPGNNLAKQLKVAGSEKSIYTPNQGCRMEYDHIFKSPWCCDESQENQYREMFKTLTSLNMDDVESTLLLLAAIFDTSGTRYVVYNWPCAPACRFPHGVNLGKATEGFSLSLSQSSKLNLVKLKCHKVAKLRNAN